jgi:spore coat polysaccharide biosynthesis predicted glycosyltransferase SpsG
MTSLVILADATARSGAGHVMRCASLADAWRDRGMGPAVIVGEVTIPFVRHRLEDSGIRIAETAPDDTDAVVVSDSYEPAVRQRAAAMRQAALRVFMDDLAEPVPAGFEVVWNPNACGSLHLYRGFDGHVIAGPSVVPLRADLPIWRKPSSERVGITLGGASPPSTVRRALLELREAMGNTPFSATGGWAPDAAVVTPEKPWESLVRCSAVITAAGATLWEACAVGMPVVVVKTAGNQRMVFDYAEANGLPTVNAMEQKDHAILRDALMAALPHAQTGPKIGNGAPVVVEQLEALLAGRRARL